MGDGDLSQLISKMVAESPDLNPKKLRPVEGEHYAFAHREQSFGRCSKDLKAIRISPILKTRIAVDEYSEYEYWYDDGQESVHYTITGPSKDAPQKTDWHSG